ncbi:RodZ domain-containing protein [Thermus thermophilus]|uniref:RodZ domain-containing protein n=1 Tax=Thermus thermophilus TaxID=274 RepID=UPI00324E9CD6
MCELGEKLREARERRGLSLGEAARQLALKAEVLEALEECRFERLPEPALARGYLRRYALLLGLDPGPLLALYPSAPSPPPPAPPRPRRALWPWLLALALLGGLLYAGFLLWPRPPEKVVELPPPPPPEAPSRYTLRVQSDPPGARVYLDGFYLGQTPLETPPLEGGERVLRLERPGYAPLERRILLDRNLSLSLALTPEKPPPQEAAEEAPANKLVLKVEGRSWLRVTRGGERLYEGIPEVGSELVFDLPVEVRSGNPGAVRVILGGKDLGPMGEPGIPVTRRYP